MPEHVHDRGCCDDECFVVNAGTGKPGEPCWGPIEPVAEEYTEHDYWWIHGCTGHHDTYDGGKYRPNPATMWPRAFAMAASVMVPAGNYITLRG
jgi:hypothetical protein